MSKDELKSLVSHSSSTFLPPLTAIGTTYSIKALNTIATMSTVAEAFVVSLV